MHLHVPVSININMSYQCRKYLQAVGLHFGFLENYQHDLNLISKMKNWYLNLIHVHQRKIQRMKF